MAALIGRGLGASVARSDARDAKSSGEGSASPAAWALVPREPTEAMLEAGPGEPYMDAYTWAKMIDAAPAACEVCGNSTCAREPLAERARSTVLVGDPRREPTEAEVMRAAWAWRNDKYRETDSSDEQYFLAHWRGLRGLGAYVTVQIALADGPSSEEQPSACERSEQGNLPPDEPKSEPDQ